MKKLVFVLLFLLFSSGAYFSTNSVFAVTGDEESGSNWFDEETFPGREQPEMDVPDDYNPQNEYEGESGDHYEVDVPNDEDNEIEESGDEEPYNY